MQAADTRQKRIGFGYGQLLLSKRRLLLMMFTGFDGPDGEAIPESYTDGETVRGKTSPCALGQ